MKDTARFFLILAAPLALATYGCSAASSDSKPNPVPGEDTGVIVARLTSVPADVQCVEIQTSDYHASDTRVDVTPGGSAEIHIGPLSPGYVWLSGAAYSVPCEQLGYYGGGYPGIADASTAPSPQTWEATSTTVLVAPGQTTQAELHFHQFGAIDVGIDFDNCDPYASFSTCGADGGPPEYDGGPAIDAGPIEWDAGMAQPAASRR